MRKTHIITRSAPIAIAAMLALGPTQLVAQDAAQPAQPVVAEPQIVVPTTTPPIVTEPVGPVTQPTIQIPDEPILPAETTAPPAATTAPVETTRAAPAPRAASPEPIVANPDAAPVNETVAPSADEGIAAVTEFEPAAVPAPVAAEAPAPASEGMNSQVAMILGGGAALLLLLGLGVALSRRRKSTAKAIPAEAPIIETERAPASQQTASVASLEERRATTVTSKLSSAETGFGQPSPASVTYMDAHEPVAPAATGQNGEKLLYKPLPHAGAAVALPATAPDTYEGRSQLLRNMIAAKPDRANPFKARKTRKKRARLIMQSLGRKFRNGSRIDFSQYPQNFPELARQQRAVA